MATPHDDWVLNVLGFSIESGALADIDGENEGDGLTERVEACAETIGSMPDGKERDPLRQELARIRGLLSAGSSREAAGALDVLETRLAELARSSRMQGVGEETKAVSLDYSKLALRWRRAQTDVSTQVREFGQTVRADTEVQNDPRYEQAMAVVAEFQDFVPRFGNELDDALHAVEHETDEVRRAQLMEDAIDVVREYLAELNDADEIEELAAVAQTEFGVSLDAVEELRSTLTAISKRLA